MVLRWPAEAGTRLQAGLACLTGPSATAAAFACVVAAAQEAADWLRGLQSQGFELSQVHALVSGRFVCSVF